MAELFKFGSWGDVLDYARGGGPLYYQAPLDHRPTKLYPCLRDKCSPYEYLVRARTIRIWPPGSVGRGRSRTSDPFTADAGHLDRFSAPEEQVFGDDSYLENPMRRFRKKNPMTSTEDLLFAGAAVAVVGLVGFAMYSKSKAAQAAVTPANQNVTQWNQTTQEAYDAWYMSQVNAGIISPTSG